MPGLGRSAPRGLVKHKAHGPRAWVDESLRREVRRLLCRGMREVDIARALGVSSGVVYRVRDAGRG